MSDIEQLQALYNEADSIVFFGGAGVSTESGIPDFRSANGLYRDFSGVSPEEILSHDFFEAHPEEFFRFYRTKILAPDARPNAAHLALARMERNGKLLGIVTQNIDGLHQMAGSRRVAELHGSVHRNYCQRCGRKYDLGFVADGGGVPRCSCGGIVRPDVVLYGESLPEDAIETALAWISRADFILVAGTSLTVYPAAGLLRYRKRGSRLALINRDATPLDAEAELVIHGKVGEALAQLAL